MFNRRLGIFSIAALCIGLVSYSSGINGDTIKNIIGDSDTARLLSDIPKDIGGVIKRVYEILGNPKDNFQQAMTGFENAAHRNNPNSRGHGDYSRIYEMMDINTIISQLQTMKLREGKNKNKPDSVLIYESYMPVADNVQ